jgi:hypothetical protein
LFALLLTKPADILTRFDSLVVRATNAMSLLPANYATAQPAPSSERSSTQLKQRREYCRITKCLLYGWLEPLFRWIFIQENIKPKSDFLMGKARCPTGGLSD